MLHISWYAVGKVVLGCEKVGNRCAVAQSDRNVLRDDQLYRKKGKDVSSQAAKKQRRGRDIARKGVSGQSHVPAALPLGKRRGTHRTGGWISLGAGLDGSEKSNLPPRFDPQTIQPVASRCND